MRHFVELHVFIEVVQLLAVALCNTESCNILVCTILVHGELSVPLSIEDAGTLRIIQTGVGVCTGKFCPDPQGGETGVRELVLNIS